MGKRLGAYMKRLTEGNLEEWETERLRTRRRKDVEKAMDGNEGFHGVATELDEMVDERTSNAVTKARESGVKDAKAVSICCHRPNCGLCLGRYPSHKPYFYAEGKKVKDVASFLSRFLDGRDVVSFLRLCEIRNQALVLLNYQQRVLVRLGLLMEEK